MSKVVMMACIGFLIICIMGAVIGLLISLVIWHMFRNNLDFEYSEEQELTENNNETE